MVDTTRNSPENNSMQNPTNSAINNITMTLWDKVAETITIK